MPLADVKARLQKGHETSVPRWVQEFRCWEDGCQSRRYIYGQERNERHTMRRLLPLSNLRWHGAQ